MKNQTSFSTRKPFFSLKHLFAMAIIATHTALSMVCYAQDGNAGIQEATNKVKGYFDTGCDLMYAIGAVVGIIGAIKVFNKYLLQQIAALQVYMGYARQGYEIADQGLSTFKGLTGGEFNLHNAFFASQQIVSPLIRRHPQVMQIISLQLSISNSLTNAEKAEIAGDENRVYIRKVAEHIREECSLDLEDLFILLTSGSLEMKDDERLKHLDRVASSMLEKADFVQRFSSEVMLLSAHKAAEQKSINHQKKLYEIDQ